GAAYWRDGDRVVVRGAATKDSPAVGEAVSTWDQQAIRLTFQPADGAAFRTDVFAREGGGTGFQTFTRAAQTVIDIRGTYRATLRDPKGVAVGWVRMKISPYQEAARIYDGVLPAAIPPELAAAGVVALDAEIDWLEDHVLDVYRGNSGGPLERSIPAPR
ncbi:MAG TPA: hypothetical protein VKA21_07660, partial [Candidatus Binatia bacterium]|nr:hypothetical protein [Candidatus Binatia bacterium]